MVEGAVLPLTNARFSRCVYCFDGDAVHAFVPCGHQCLCGDCAARATEMLDADGEISCYVCQVASSAVIRIYATS